MTDSLQPTSASLAAKIIRKCPVHDTCSLDCPRRPFEELGTIASFEVREERAPPSIIQRLKEGVTQWLH